MLRKLLLAFALLVLPAGAPSAPATQAPDAARAAWGFDRSDLTPHKGVRFGVLPNGMRYALMRNAAPAGALSVRLHLDGGSSMEREREQGYMHLIEHLIFEGSANLPQGTLAPMLQHQGLRRWSDFNAFTTFDETVYRLDLGRADARARETALMLMREISSNLLFDRKVLEAAKSMVQAEISGRDAVQDRMATAQNAFFFPGAPIGRGSVASTDRSVRRAKGKVLRRLYERSYLPSRATIVLVGDFDPAVAEREVVARFSDWGGGAAGESPPSYLPSTGTRKPSEVKLFVEAAAPTKVVIATVEPLGGPDATAQRDSRFLEYLGSEMLSRRLARIAAGGNAQFRSGESLMYDHFSTARLAAIELGARNGDWRGALTAGAKELRRALDDGFSQAELDEQLAASRRALTPRPGARTSPTLADAIVDAVGRGIVFTEPSDGSATAAYLARVRLADVNVAFRSAWSRPNRLIFVSHHKKIPDGEAAIIAAWREASQR